MGGEGGGAGGKGRAAGQTPSLPTVGSELQFNGRIEFALKTELAKSASHSS